MNAYVDSSVVLRVVLSQDGRLAEWNAISTAVASRLLEVECLRTVDRLRLTSGSIDRTLTFRERVYRILEGVRQIELTPSLLHRAAQPAPAPLGTLDAIHLATAESWRELEGADMVFATHDQALARAARASGFRVIG